MLSFALACAVLMLIPGPNVALITANSIAHGTRHGLLTVCVTVGALAVQIALVLLGLSALLRAAAGALDVLRWAGVCYLVILGIQAFRAPPEALDVSPAPGSVRRLALRAALIVLTNPKTLLFITALFPQFLDAARPAGPQLLTLAAIMLMLEFTIDCGWAIAAARARTLFGRGRWRGRVTGGLMLGAGAGLALARAE